MMGFRRVALVGIKVRLGNLFDQRVAEVVCLRGEARWMTTRRSRRDGDEDHRGTYEVEILKMTDQEQRLDGAREDGSQIERITMCRLPQSSQDEMCSF